MQYFLDRPGYPETQSDAVDILKVVHTRRDETEHQRYAAEKAVHRCIDQLTIVQKRGDEQAAINQALVELEYCRTALTRARGAASQADDDVGLVRSVLRRKGFPVNLDTEPPDPHGINMPHWSVPEYRDITFEETESIDERERGEPATRADHEGDGDVT